jgi:hypothetical protein
LKPFTRTSSARRSAFSLLAKTPSWTAQPDSDFCGALVGFDAEAAGLADFDVDAEAAFVDFDWAAAAAGLPLAGFDGALA